MSLAVLCSGQGRQERGLFAMFAGEPAARPVLAATAARLGWDSLSHLDRLSDAELFANRTGQLLCVARALAAVAVLDEVLPPDAIVAGYSVGELAAWGVTGLWSPSETLDLADGRARAMDAASGADDGLAYVRGLPLDQVEALAARFGCEIAIVNPDRLTILGGVTADLTALCEAALAGGALRAAPMPVHVASHTSRLAAAADDFLDRARAIPVRRPRRALMSATGPRLYRAVAPDVASLAGQIATAIDWNAVLDALYERGVRRLIEFGPGQSLATMARGQSRFDARALDEFDGLAGVAAWIGKV
ncbi:(acyl-carrier-protein) S-malonyltransferase-like protein [Rhizorhabdus wittichii RW1]|uniref:(Acyl-carrier-protein) S-malonyltransferase-like protein n=1 Tax=Rhizorhabdus wittichii (strain DSM 6014 / CCUG 31198 / JCM 15750 / NBRC 105917 / EY 4224 / RW1) TaxID=392499 RepID=A0A9J9HFJ2_RHIWR|nr:(acyl-carrier-protein) S-malonyltransferase-like protein [Rhizorhabdus wittichii RW1]